MHRSGAWCGCYCLSLISVTGLQGYGTRSLYNHALSSVSNAVNELIRHPAVEWDDIDSINGNKSIARKKLKPIHSSLFQTSTVFDRFAKVVCNTGESLPRYERNQHPNLASPCLT